jgi:hypothetical protein
MDELFQDVRQRAVRQPDETPRRKSVMDDVQEREVARGLREGNADAWRPLYDAYAERVWSAVARLIRSLFELENVGEKIVRIVALRKTSRKIPAGSPAPAGTMVDEVIQCIPKQFNDESTLRIQVTAGRSNTHDFDLKLDGTKR